MQIKQQALIGHLQKKLEPIYVLVGQDNYLIEEAFHHIKASIKKAYDYDEKIISVQSPDDWNTVIQEANNYSLFSEIILLNIVYDKKTIDAAGKKALTAYLKAINSRCFIIIRAPNVPLKQLMWLSNQNQAVVVAAYPLNADAMKNWIIAQFKQSALAIGRQVPDLIYQYTQGNMLACAQVIEKIKLVHTGAEPITTQHALEHLFNQCDHSLFELTDACLLGQADKGIQILRQALSNKSESTLILWMLTQEVRLLLQLFYLVELKTDFKSACSQLKIWPQRTNLYQLALKRFDHAVLKHLLLYSKRIDEQIKSSLNTQVANSLEKLLIALCLGRAAGALCIL